jgi:hypothetical protein
MRRAVALLLVAGFGVGVAGCGGSSDKPVSVGELQRALDRQGLQTFVILNQQERPRGNVSVAIPLLVRNFPSRRFVTATAVIADQKARLLGSLPGTVRVEGYVFDTDAAAESAAAACSACLAARNVVVIARPAARTQVEAALSGLG